MGPWEYSNCHHPPLSYTTVAAILSSQYLVQYELIFLFGTQVLSQYLKFCLPAINSKQLSDTTNAAKGFQAPLRSANKYIAISWLCSSQHILITAYFNHNNLVVNI